MPGVQSIERAFLLLDVVATADLGVTELATRVDLPKSTVARLLKTLEQVGAVERVPPDGRYRIGGTVAGLAGGGRTAADLAARTRPHLRLLARETGEDAGLAIPDGYQVHYIAQEDAENQVQVRNWTGTLIPMYVVPSGLVMLASWPEERIARYLQRDRETFTPFSVIGADAIRARLDGIRSDGHVWVVEEFAEGITSVAAPVFDDEDRVIAAIHVHGPSYRFPGERNRIEITELVSEAAQRMSSAPV